MPSIINATLSNGLVTSADNSGSLQLQTNNGTTAVTIDTSQNVGIGTSSPNEAMTIQRGAGVSAATTYRGNGTTASGEFYVGHGADAIAYLYNRSNQPLVFATNNAERMRIASGGQLLINTTTLNNGAQINVYGNNTTNGTYEWASPKGSNNSHMHYGTFGDWYIRPANNSGKVYVLNYQAESDQRLKKDIAPITYGLNEIQQLQPRQFKWKNGDDSEVNGFIAQEVEAVIPTLVSEGQWKSVDYQGITAILVKAIQELKAELDATKAEVQALKGAA